MDWVTWLCWSGSHRSKARKNRPRVVLPALGWFPYAPRCNGRGQTLRETKGTPLRPRDGPHNWVFRPAMHPHNSAADLTRPPIASATSTLYPYTHPVGKEKRLPPTSPSYPLTYPSRIVGFQRLESAARCCAHHQSSVNPVDRQIIQPATQRWTWRYRRERRWNGRYRRWWRC